MAKERFKVGDKVVAINPELWQQGNNIGTVVIESTPSMPLITVEWKENGTLKKSYFTPLDIKRAYQKGQQLLFYFAEN